MACVLGGGVEWESVSTERRYAEALHVVVVSKCVDGDRRADRALQHFAPPHADVVIVQLEDRGVWVRLPVAHLVSGHAALARLAHVTISAAICSAASGSR